MKKVSVLTVCLVLIILIATAVIGLQAIKIKRLESQRISFSPDEPFPSLELLSLDNSQQDFKEFSEGITVLFVFKTPCSACNSNLSPWNNIAKFFGNRIKTLGIIPDGDPAAVSLMNEKKSRLYTGRRKRAAQNDAIKTQYGSNNYYS